MSCSLLHALAWIKDQNFHNIDVEMEGKVIADKLYNNSIGRFDLQVLINKCKRFLLNFSNLVVSFHIGNWKGELVSTLEEFE